MRTKNFFIVKLVAVTMMLGLFSPSITVQESVIPSKVASTTQLDMSQELLAKLSTSEINFTLFNEAEARSIKRKRNKVRRKAIRKGHRRANYRHHRKKERRRNVVGAVVGAAVVGAVVNEVISD